MDTVTKARRSEIMRRIQGDELEPERLMHKSLRRLGLRPQRNPQGVLGKPDFFWPRRRVAVFVDGCLWHRCPKHYKCPKSNVSFWHSKIWNNVVRDTRTTAVLEAAGFQVIRVWECQVRRHCMLYARAIQSAISGARWAKLALARLYTAPPEAPWRSQGRRKGAACAIGGAR